MMKWIEEPGTVGQNVDQTCLQRCQDLAKLLPASDQAMAMFFKCPAQCAIPAGGSAPPGTTPTTPTTPATKKSSNTGLIVAGVVIGAIALAALAAS
jgi:hypothetical protein